MAEYDSFVRDRLPPADQTPEFLLLNYPERLNAAAELLKRGEPDNLAVVKPTAAPGARLERPCTEMAGMAPCCCRTTR